MFTKSFVQLKSIMVAGFCISPFLLASEAQAGTNGRPSIQLIGAASFSGTARDKSAGDEHLETGVPHNRLGGISALEYTGTGNRYIALPDRGPDDGATGYECRYQVLEIAINPGSVQPVTAELLETHLLTDASGRPFTGSAAAFERTEHSAGRLDPEGLRLSSDGKMYISDEYGPHLLAFEPVTHDIQRFALPAHLQIAHPSESRTAENQQNRVGRASNRGMEGLALSQDGRFLYGLMQSALLQDATISDKGYVLGRYSRLVEVEIANGKVREFAYPMEDPTFCMSEILAIGPGQFLVVERDSAAGAAASFRKLMQVDIRQATNIVAEDSLSATQLPSNIVPVKKSVFLDFSDPDFHLCGDQMPEKIEGLTFGPKLADGRQSLVVAIDNDFVAEQPTLFWVFAVSNDVAVSVLTQP